ncbi:unnamed protein product [Closterium sp. Naga37s-1]|nr:unnamed protein product [Closterium sp. Naga37s-1]
MLTLPHRRAPLPPPPCPLVARVLLRLRTLGPTSSWPSSLSSCERPPFLSRGCPAFSPPGRLVSLHGAPSQPLAPHIHLIRPPHLPVHSSPPLFSPPSPSCLSSLPPPPFPLHLLQLAAGCWLPVRNRAPSSSPKPAPSAPSSSPLSLFPTTILPLPPTLSSPHLLQVQ